MNQFPPTIILRHRKENKKKCSLTPFENHPDFIFFSYPFSFFPSFENYILLSLEGPPLTKKDSSHGLFLIDATWRYAALIEKKIQQTQNFIIRSLPKEITTAYPRKQTLCPDPSCGLSSIEALFAASLILGRKTEGLLDHYYWKEAFLEKNNVFFRLMH